MRFILLSRYAQLYSTRRLVEAARARGHRIRIVDPVRCYLSLSTQHSGIHYQGRAITGIDGVLPRIGTSITSYGTSVVRQFEIQGATVQNPSAAILRTRNKLCMLQHLVAAGIPIPETAMAFAPEDNPALLGLLPPPPLIIKLIEGSQGIGVVLAENPEAAESVTETLRALMAHFLVQRFVTESRGRDLRYFVIGDEIAAAIERRNPKGGFRANLHQGGSARRIPQDPVAARLARTAARILGLHVAGVDLLETDSGPVVLEVNATPGLEGVEKATRIDIAGRMIRDLERRILERRTHPPRSGPPPP